MSTVYQINTEAPATNENKKYISPFSCRCGYTLNWTKVNPRITGNTNKSNSWASDKIITVLKVINQVKIITLNQIAKTFWPNKKKSYVIKKIEKLSNFGVLVPHELVKEKRKVQIVTLGPLGCSAIEELYRPNWWIDLEIKTVLKQLIANQFFLRVYRNIEDCKYLPTPFPFNGVVIFNNLEFPLVVARDDLDEVMQEIKWLKLEKALFIFQDYEDIERIAPEVTAQARYTTDYNLCNVPLRYAFYKYKDNKVVQEVIPMFPENG